MESHKYSEWFLTRSEVKHELIAALVALVRATSENNTSTDNTLSVLKNALLAFAHGSDAECKEHLELVRREKNLLAPDCAVCANPCARTAEYPVTEFLEEDARLREMKSEMLFEIIDDPTIADNDLLRKLFMFGYEKDVGQFADFLKKV